MAAQPTERETRFRVVAESQSKAGDLIVEDRFGQQRLLIGSVGTLSHASLPPEFLESLLRMPGWRLVSDPRWYTLKDLVDRFSTSVHQRRRTLPNRVASALGLWGF